ncbi:MFS transporter [Saccharothrix variisporea]|uniref:MFS transporter n=1 Tax=Saccharothrix variisporea TaxID=543527 RepID=A0A495X5I4_9PSEU|nr:MFS transporter [Saccharothrix variisporea]RKT69222.1 MFS transporter [Saccharothrix variisporea]
MSATDPPSAAPKSFLKSLVPEPGDKRTFVTSQFISGIGGGIIMPISILYFTRIVGIAAGEVGVAFMVAGLLAIPFSVPAGDLADRIGPRRVALSGLLGLSAAGVGFLFVQNSWTLLAAQSVITFSFAAYLPSAGALMRRVGGEQTVTLRSQVRVVANGGVALGTLVAGIGVDIGGPLAYRVLLVLFVLAQLSAGLLLLRLPRLPAPPRPPKQTGGTRAPRWIALRDLPFVAYTFVGGAMMLQSMILEILIPVWIVSHTVAPAWGITVAFVLNTVMVVLLQVRLGSKVQTVGDGGVALRRAGLVLLLGCVALSLMAEVSSWVALLLLIAGMVLLTLGEIWHASGTFAFEYGLPPAHAQGQYQGLSTTTSGVVKAAAPALLLGVTLSFGSTGWIGLGVLLLVLGLLGPAIAGWGERTRQEAEPEPTQADTTTGSST